MEIRKFSDCISDTERSNRLGMIVVNLLIWLFIVGLVIGSLGAWLVFILVGWAVGALTAAYQARLLRAMGARVTPGQFPEIYEACEEIRKRFGVAEEIPVIVIAHASVNAFAMRFTNRKMIVLFSETVLAIKDSPEQLRFFIAHEMCHCVLDHGSRRYFEIYKPAKFKRGRELTCDNAGLAAARSLSEAHAALAKLIVGKDLWGKLQPQELIDDSAEIMSGFIGWLLGQYLTHPPCGARIENLAAFDHTAGISAEAPETVSA